MATISRTKSNIRIVHNLIIELLYKLVVSFIEFTGDKILILYNPVLLSAQSIIANIVNIKDVKYTYE